MRPWKVIAKALSGAFHQFIQRFPPSPVGSILRTARLQLSRSDPPQGCPAYQTVLCCSQRSRSSPEARRLPAG